MDKGSEHPYAGLEVYFGTKHGKEAAIRPLFFALGCTVRAVDIDTDLFGTFTGEVERQGSVRDALRAKIRATFERHPEARLAIASEGSFGPHPFLGFIQSDHEALLFVDRALALEIYVDDLSTDTNHSELVYSSGIDLEGFCARARFPSHHLVVQSMDRAISIKGIHELYHLQAAIEEVLSRSGANDVRVATDMRAFANPTRMAAIARCGTKLLERLQARCPSCASIGFGSPRAIAGLPCEACGTPTALTHSFALECPACGFEELRPRPDGLIAADPGSCEICNP